MCRVLIVDDEILVRQGIKYVLDWEREGFQIIGEAANGREALASVQALNPHIVITDIVMPVMDGEELTRIVKRDYPATEVIVLSSFSEFDYVRSSFQSGVADYILKPKLEAGGLLHVLQKTRDRIPGLKEEQPPGEQRLPLDSLLSRLITGYELQATDAVLLQEQFPQDCYTLIGCENSRTGQYIDTEAADRGLTAMQEQLKRQVPGIVLCMVQAEGHTLLLLNLGERQFADAIGAVRELSSSLTESEPALRWYVSRIFKALGEAAAVYRESYMGLRQYSFFFAGRMLMVESELPPCDEPAPKFNMAQFTEQLKRLQLEEAFNELREHTAQLVRNYRSDVFQFKSFLGNIIFMVTNQFSHLKELEDRKYELFRAVDEALSADEAAGIVEAFLDQVMELTSSASPSPGGQANMKKLLEYIEEHYAEPLSLTGLSRHFHFNPSYLSSLFTAHNQEGFKEHLNTVRTGKAAKLLRAGEAPISEISSMVGYGDHSYFCKVFKKYTGLSPSSYRRQYYGQGQR
jgi:two-component system response regulator YesN